MLSSARRSDVIFLISAHTKSDFSETRQKPNSLVYYQDTDNEKSYWLTYDRILDDWTKGYLSDCPEEASKYVTNAAESKYNTAYTFASEAPQKSIPLFNAILKNDTVVNAYREVEITLIPKRTVNQISLFAHQEFNFNPRINGKSLSADSSENGYAKRKGNGLLRFYVADNDSLE